MINPTITGVSSVRQKKTWAVAGCHLCETLVFSAYALIGSPTTLDPRADPHRRVIAAIATGKVFPNPS